MAGRAVKPDDIDVFVNCPFDDHYAPLFRAMVFCVQHCGFRVRCAWEVEDSAAVRIDLICEIIAESRFGIHDISWTQLDPGTALPRFNMPLELGLFLGARRFGTARQRSKQCLILDRQRYRYQAFLSDIAGQDIQSHDNSAKSVVRVVRNWLQAVSRRNNIPGGSAIWIDYEEFRTALPRLAEQLRLALEELTYLDYLNLVATWLNEGGMRGELRT